MLWWTIRQLKSTDKNKRLKAVKTLSSSKDSRVGAHLIPLLKDEDAIVRHTAAETLANVKSPEVEQALSDYRLSEEEIKRRAEAAQAKHLADEKQKKADEAMLKKMLELAAHYDRGGTSSDNPGLLREVMEIGRTLHRRGGRKEMMRVFMEFSRRYKTPYDIDPWLPAGHGQRTVELNWEEIEDWSRRWHGDS